MSQDSSESSSCCARSDHPDVASAELKLYRAFIFSVPIFFTFILLFLFYVFYLRPRRVDWASLRMRAFTEDNNDISRPSESGLSKELREMLPVIIYKESFYVKDTQCSVCLLDYQQEDRLQQIPACSHTFHMNCIDLWLANHRTCPLCRLSLSAKSSEMPNIQEIDHDTNNEETSNVQSSELRPTRHPDVGVHQNWSGEAECSANCSDLERGNTREQLQEA
ncbi:hypothetical protein L6164_023618 [Bauhinia variegata]|uniref:Uncharacterized protein n=1 Tax=Bauhinia variegata TaxID=167791 RepID=A0ACB9MJ33_BAUVA|nr:hypothetical protein L6164_023618 [Bauhinia variegata]